MRFQPVIPESKHRRGTALRIAVIGGLGLFLFSVLFFRLWSLQVVTGDEYLAEATENRTREIRVRPPRGRILDRDGNVLVDNRTRMALQLDPIEVPEPGADRRKLFVSVAGLIDRKLEWVRNRYRKEIEENPPGSPVTLVDDVDDDLVFYLQEHQSEYPEVQVNRVFVRKYPQGLEAAHILGSVGEVTADDLEDTDDPDIEGGDSLGKTGIEQTYDDVLRGSAGTTRVQVDSDRQGERPAGLGPAGARKVSAAHPEPGRPEGGGGRPRVVPLQPGCVRCAGREQRRGPGNGVDPDL